MHERHPLQVHRARSARGGPRSGPRRYASIFAPGDFYVELQEQGIVADNGVSQTQINRELAAIAGELGLPTVATNDIHYLTREDAKTQDLLLCIGTGSTVDQAGRMKFSCDEFYMKSAEEMAESIGRDYPEAIANTLEIAEKCNVEIETDKHHPADVRGARGPHRGELPARACIEGLKVRYGDPVPDEVDRRASTTSSSIVGPKGIAAYFLIVQDFTRWAKEHGIGVGPGRARPPARSSPTRSASPTSTRSRNGLLFERFLNPERTEMPDIDMDFDDERRGEVIDYVRDKYGADKVAQIITFGTMKARAAVRDAGRVLGYPYGVPDKISKMIGDELDATIDSSLEAERRVHGRLRAPIPTPSASSTPRAPSRASSRGEGVHAAGVVICRDPLHFHVPVKYDTKGGAVITQYDGPTVARHGPAQDGLPGLAHAHRHRQGGRERRAQPRHPARTRRLPARRPRDVRAAAARRHRRRVPGRVARHAAAAQAT